MKARYFLPVVIAGLFSGSVMAASFSISPSATTVPVASAPGTELTFVLSYENSGTAAFGIQTDVQFDGNQLTYVSHSGSGCSHPTATSVRVIRADLDGVTWPSGDLCTIVVSVNADNNGTPWAAGDTSQMTITGSIISGATGDMSGDLTAPTHGDITIVAEGPPTLTFDTTPVALPGGPFGSTQSGTIPANFTASSGAHSVDYTCTAPAGFTVTPATGSYDNDDTTATDLTVTARSPVLPRPVP